jgi:hypothetical protein
MKNGEYQPILEIRIPPATDPKTSVKMTGRRRMADLRAESPYY